MNSSSSASEKLTIRSNGTILGFYFSGDIDNEVVDCFEDEINDHLHDFDLFHVDLTRISQIEAKVGRIIEVVNDFHNRMDRIVLRENTLRVINEFIGMDIKCRTETIPTAEEKDFMEYVVEKTSERSDFLCDIDVNIRRIPTLSAREYSRSIATQEYIAEVVDIQEDYVVLSIINDEKETVSLRMNRKAFADEDADFIGARIVYLIIHTKDEIARKIILTNAEPTLMRSEPLSFQETKKAFMAAVADEKATSRS